MDYPVSVEHEVGGRVRVLLPDFPGTQAMGADEAEGLLQAQKVLAAAFEQHIRERRSIPFPSAIGQHYVTVPALIAVKVRLYDAMRAADVGKAELARRLRWHLPQVDRLFDLGHGSRLEQLEAAFAALGKRLVVDVLDEGAPIEPARHAARAAVRPGVARTGDAPAAADSAAPAFEVQWD